jgi:TPR repeat protein
MPETRKRRERTEENRQENKQRRPEDPDERRRRVLEDIAEDWTCPITYELFFEPVEAEDGKLYERAAIEEYFNRKADQVMVKSPVTNVDMGKRIVPATHVKNAIARLVESGLLGVETSAAWRKAKANQTQVKALHAKAEQGDPHAMGRLGFSYRDGTRGLAKNPREAFKWFKKAADGRDPPAATSCGVAYINGSGVERSHIRGISMITLAATLGSEHACSVLGWANECGHHGFDKNEEEATRWYKEMGKCACLDSVDVYRERARKWLELHP